MGHRVHSGSLGLTWTRLGVVGFISVLVGSLGRAKGCLRGHSGWHGFNRASQEVVGLMRVRVGSLVRAKGSFIRVLDGSLWRVMWSSV